MGVCGHDCACDVRVNGGVEPPWYWRGPRGETRSHGIAYHDEVEEEYVKSMGSKLVRASKANGGVVKCVRVQDSKAWAAYARKRAEIRSRHPPELKDLRPQTSELLDYSAVQTLDHPVNEVWLFHGTSEDAARAIAMNDFRLPSGTGNFGKGLYFADAAAKSWTYAKTTGDGNRVIMLCRVLLGNMKSISGTDRNAERQVVGTEFDSLMGIAIAPYREFLVYDVAQVYPEYIMYCREGFERTPDEIEAFGRMSVGTAQKKDCQCTVC